MYGLVDHALAGRERDGRVAGMDGDGGQLLSRGDTDDDHLSLGEQLSSRASTASVTDIIVCMPSRTSNQKHENVLDVSHQIMQKTREHACHVTSKFLL